MCDHHPPQDFDYQWLVDEVKANLPRELDFRHEAANAEMCRANLSSHKSRLRGKVHVPEVRRASSSEACSPKAPRRGAYSMLVEASGAYGAS